MRAQVHRPEALVHVRPEVVLVHRLPPVQALVQNVDNPDESWAEKPLKEMINAGETSDGSSRPNGSIVWIESQLRLIR